MRRYLYLIIMVLLLVGCGGGERVRAVYHWKTTFNPTEYELQWLRDHKVQRIYLRLFDVDVYDGEGGAAPIATTRFMQPLPDSMEIVPVVYITNEAMEKMWGGAERIVERVLKMADCNGFEVHEVQVDCDWTGRTKNDYYWLCQRMQELLHERDIELSSTVRLHQVDSTLAELSVDHSVLMLYNTGDLRNAKTRNSILDYNDVKPYLGRLNSQTMDSMGVAWPVFGWGVAFDEEGHFSHIVGPATLAADSSAGLREEWGEMEQMRRVQRRLPRRRGSEVVLYHLDSLNLSKYTYDEIEELYNR